MSTETVKIDQELNSRIWMRGINRPPTRANWWYIRAASIARQIYMNNTASVAGLTFRYGANQDNGSSPSHHQRASRKIVRVILQQLEKADLVKKRENKGRSLTPNGQKLLDQIAKETAQH
jgi:small subunit ribosomal protein S19e